jgi:hypothetical protein
MEHPIAKYHWQVRAEFQPTATNRSDGYGTDLNDTKPVQVPNGMTTPAPQQKQ